MRLQDARVILVEDNMSLAENVAEILEDEGAQVRRAANAAAGRALASEPFDVALVDVRLPDATGLELLPLLRSAGDGTAEILLVTGNATVEDAVKAVEGGAYAYILKPFQGEDLIGHVERAYRQVRSSRKEERLIEQVRIREQRLRTLVDTVQAVLLVLDHDGRVVQANPAATALTGVAVERLVGMSWIESFVPAAQQDEVLQVLRKANVEDGPVTHENVILRRGASGVEERLVSWRSSPLEQDGELLVYSSGLDITEIREYERRAELQGRLAALGTLSAGLAHEIRNPLNSARLQLQVLERRCRKLVDDPHMLAPIDLVKDEILRLSRLLNEFLEFARPQALSLATIDLGEMVTRVVALEQPVATEKGVELLVDAEPKVVITGDVEKLHQALLNLLRNALEATPAGGTVRLSLRRDQDGATIRVADTGPGIPPALLARVFEPFFTTKSGGTGLGMSICHSLIARHGGHIAVRSEPRSGAEFVISLPLAPPRDLAVATS